MKLLKLLTLLAGVTLGLTFAGTSEAKAGYYYGGWNHYASHGYYYTSYYYTPARYHYCIYYPQYPRYVYYYNPYQRVYWGRFDLEGKEGAQYSELAEEHKKGKVADIKEEHFPKAGTMPKNPEGVEGNIPALPTDPRKEIKDVK